MPIAILFWVLMLFWLLFGLWADYVPGQPYPVMSGARSFLIFILLGILGYATFGSAIK